MDDPGQLAPEEKALMWLAHEQGYLAELTSKVEKLQEVREAMEAAQKALEQSPHSRRIDAFR